MHTSLPLFGREEREITIQVGYVQWVDRADLFHLAFCEQMVKTKMWWSCCIVCPLLFLAFCSFVCVFPSLIPSVFSSLPQGYSLRVIEPTLSLTHTRVSLACTVFFMHVEAALSFSLSFLRHHSCIWLPWTVAAIWAGSLSPRTVHGHTGNRARKWNRYCKKRSLLNPFSTPNRSLHPCTLYPRPVPFISSHSFPLHLPPHSLLPRVKMKIRFGSGAGSRSSINLPWCTMWGYRCLCLTKATSQQLQLGFHTSEQLEHQVLSAAQM